MKRLITVAALLGELQHLREIRGRRREHAVAQEAAAAFLVATDAGTREARAARDVVGRERAADGQQLRLNLLREAGRHLVQVVFGAVVAEFDHILRLYYPDEVQ